MTTLVRRAKPRPKGSFSCGSCRRWWQGKGMCHCSGCHRTFGGMSNFDRHRRRGVCLDPRTLVGTDGTSLMVQAARAGGLVWVSPDTRDHSKHEDEE